MDLVFLVADWTWNDDGFLDKHHRLQPGIEMLGRCSMQRRGLPQSSAVAPLKHAHTALLAGIALGSCWPFRSRMLRPPQARRSSQAHLQTLSVPLRKVRVCLQNLPARTSSMRLKYRLSRAASVKSRVVGWDTESVGTSRSTKDTFTAAVDQ